MRYCLGVVSGMEEEVCQGGETQGTEKAPQLAVDGKRDGVRKGTAQIKTQ